MERPWGRHDLSDWVTGVEPSGKRIGEVWLTGSMNLAHGVAGSPGSRCKLPLTDLVVGKRAGQPRKGFDVLIKLLFPAAHLSVQVHPDDAYAKAHGLGCGKTEAWYVMAAEPGAEIGLGVKAGAQPQTFADACREGKAAGLLRWMPVQAGDFVYVPAGTVHAIGPGVVICEVQQQSDVTFRLDDYGRRNQAGELRELHLDHGLAALRQTEAGIAGARSGGAGVSRLLANEFFCVWHWRTGTGGAAMPAATGAQPQVWIHVGTPPAPPLCVRLESGDNATEVALPRGNALLIPDWVCRRSVQGDGELLIIEEGRR